MKIEFLKKIKSADGLSNDIKYFYIHVRTSYDSPIKKVMLFVGRKTTELTTQ